MQFEVGALVVAGAWPGHTLLCVKAGTDGVGSQAEFIHATAKRLRVDRFDNYDSKKQQATLLFNPETAAVFTPKQADGQAAAQMAQRILDGGAQYGMFVRAPRVLVGGSDFGKAAMERLTKYRERLKKGGAKDVVVKTVTCSELAVLSYQLTMKDGAPGFIQLDAAHVMPRSLRSYLEGTEAFAKVSTGSKVAAVPAPDAAAANAWAGAPELNVDAADPGASSLDKQVVDQHVHAQTAANQDGLGQGPADPDRSDAVEEESRR